MLDEYISKQELDRLTHLNIKMPALLPVFTAISCVPPTARLPYAQKRVAEILRGTYQHLSVPVEKVETVAGHIAGTRALVGKFNLSAVNARRGDRMAEIHDLPNAMTGNLNPYNSTQEDRAFLKAIAGRVLFEADDNDMKLFREYLDNVTVTSHAVHDAGILQLWTQVHHYELAHPEMKGRFDQLWRRAPNSLATEEGREMARNLHLPRFKLQSH